MEEDDQKPLMDEEPMEPQQPPMMEEDNRIRDNSNDPKYCCCCSMKCGIITIAIYIIVDLIINCVKAYYIANNAYFDEPWDCYFLIFALCLLPQFISLMLVSLYLCQKDSEESRNRLPLAVILAFSTSVALALWITIYICFIYESDDGTVMTGTGDKAEEGQEETNYSQTSKE